MCGTWLHMVYSGRSGTNSGCSGVREGVIDVRTSHVVYRRRLRGARA